MKKIKILDLFSGLGGFSLGLERTGHFETTAFCEIDKFCKLILDKHWKGTKIYNNVKEITKERLEADGIQFPDIITGGFPCQSFSVAGKQKGTSDSRYLWPEMFRIIKIFKPRYVIGENVRGIVNIENGMVFETVCSNLEDEGYEVQPFLIPAASVGALHKRERIWFIASLENSRRTLQQGTELFDTNEDEIREEDANQHQRSGSPSEFDVANTESIRTGESREFNQEERSEGSGSTQLDGSSSTQLDGSRSEMANTNGERLEGFRQSSSQFNETSSSSSSSEERQGKVDHGWWSVEPNVGRVAHGVSGRVHRLKGLGNSIVPQIVEEIGKAIIKAEKE